MVRLTIHLSHSIARRLIDRSCPGKCRCVRHEWLFLSLLGGKEFFAQASFFVLRAHAAQNHKDRVGLFRALRRRRIQCLLRHRSGYPYPLLRCRILINPSKSISRFSASFKSGWHCATRCGPLTSHLTASAPVFQRYTQPTTLRLSAPIKFAIATPSTSSSFTVY